MSDIIHLDQVQKIARLARLSLTDAEVQKYAGQMTNILKFAEQLSEVDTRDVAPLASVSDIALTLREDVVSDGNLQKEVLQNAPEALEGYFVVQKVVE